MDYLRIPLIPEGLRSSSLGNTMKTYLIALRHGMSPLTIYIAMRLNL